MYAAAYSCFKSSSTSDAEIQSHMQANHSTKLFGPHAKLTLQNSPPVLQHEDVLMQQLRLRLGPYAAPEALQYHLRAARGKLNWAVNTYFRAVLASETSCTDFQPKHYAQLTSTSNTTISNHTEAEDAQPLTAAFACLPTAIFEQILQATDLLTVCNARASCKSLRVAASSDMLWQQLYYRRWHSNPRRHHIMDVIAARQSAADATECKTTSIDWHKLYQRRHTAECQMQCPVCLQSKVVPVVYGFPSHLLTLAMRADMLRMGNDHLIEGQPVWTCTACCVELYEFPFLV